MFSEQEVREQTEKERADRHGLAGSIIYFLFIGTGEARVSRWGWVGLVGWGGDARGRADDTSRG